MTDLKRVGCIPFMATRIKSCHNWLPGWEYRFPINITGGSSGAQTDYQLKLDIPALEGNFNDLRFTRADGETLIDAWLESKVDNTSAVVWVKFPTTPANTVEQKYYMYYGNTAAASAWDGAATFLQYHGAASSSFLDALVLPATNVVYEVKARANNDANLKYGVANTEDRTDDEMSIATSPQATDRRYHACKNEGATSYKEEPPNFVTSQWYHGLCYNTGSISRGYWDDNEIGSGGISTNLPNENMGLWFSVGSGSGEQEWSFARKYATNPPAYDFGDKESY